MPPYADALIRRRRQFLLIAFRLAAIFAIDIFAHFHAAATPLTIIFDAAAIAARHYAMPLAILPAAADASDYFAATTLPLMRITPLSSPTLFSLFAMPPLPLISFIIFAGRHADAVSAAAIFSFRRCCRHMPPRRRH